MKKLNLITGILSCIFLYACNNNVPETMNELNEDMRKYIFTVKDYQWDDNGKSRTQVNSTGAFAWADNDTIGIVPEQGSQVYFAIDPKDAGSDQATFNGGAWGLKANSKYAAYFPFVQDIMLDRTKVPVDYTGQVIAGKTTDNLGFYDYMAARPTGTNESGGLNFEFKHLGVMTVLTFQVPTPGEVTQLFLP